MENLGDRINQVRRRIAEACGRIKRDPADIVLVAVTKTVTTEVIEAAFRCGLTAFGENRVQEAKIKIAEIGKRDSIKWHLVGHLQTNKVRDAIEMFDLIHSVDSLRLCGIIDERAKTREKIVDILLELNMSGEKTKYGFSEKEIFANINLIGKFSNIRVLGLMTMAPFSGKAEKSRPYFRSLFNLSKKISETKLPENVKMEYLSMGMTQDYEVAIEEGANMVRIGRAIFGERQDAQ